MFRYFEDTEALLEAAMARHISRIAPLFEVDDVGVGPLEERIRRFTAARLELYRVVAPTARASLLRASTRPIIAARFARTRAEGRALIEAMFAPELRALPAGGRRAAVAAADTLFQFESLEHLRVRLGLSQRNTSEALHRSLRALLAPDVD